VSVVAEGRSFRRIDGLSRVLRALLGVGIVVDVVNIVVTFLETQTLERFRNGLTDLHEVNDAFDRSRVVGIVVAICYLSTIVVWLVWQHRGQSNLHALAIPRLTFSPGWAVGWWLIPIANLWKPFQTVRELWKASDGDEAWWRLTTWSAIGWWWACWVAFNILYNTTIRFYGSETATVNSYIIGDWTSISGDLVSIVAAVLAISIVRSVTDRQARLVDVIADRTVIPARPDIVDEGPGRNP
jgi:hypothetical protein